MPSKSFSWRCLNFILGCASSLKHCCCSGLLIDRSSVQAQNGVRCPSLALVTSTAASSRPSGVVRLLYRGERFVTESTHTRLLLKRVSNHDD